VGDVGVGVELDAAAGVLDRLRRAAARELAVGESATRRPGICASAFRISSVTPSAKNSSFGSRLRLVNGSTAMDCSSSRSTGGSSFALDTAERRDRSSRAVCGRASGSFSRQRSIARSRDGGRSPRREIALGGRSRRMAEASSADERPSNGLRPVDIS
jgi:hypothetical protein